ncbi:MAG: SLC13 family permease, partial [Desulfobacterales bacterium]
MSILIVSVILLAVPVILVTEIMPVDRAAIGIIVALALSGVMTPQEAVLGFSNPAVITVAAMFLLSRGMVRTGGVEYVVEKVLHYSRGNRNAAVTIVLLMVAGASAFINNTPVVALFIPIVLGLSCDYDISPSKLLIPVSYASILAGTCTLIGTSTNIIVSDLSAFYGYGEIRMFELAGLGVPIAVIGLILIFIFSPRLMPAHISPLCDVEDKENKQYLAELIVPRGSALIGKDLMGLFASGYPSLVTIEIIRGIHIIDPVDEPVVIAADDILLVKGSADDLVRILNAKVVELPHAEEGIRFGKAAADDLIVELIVPPQSSRIRERLLSTNLQGDPDIHIIAIQSRRLHYSEQKIQNVRLRLGDIILARCSRHKLAELRRGTDFIIVEDIHHEIIDKSKVKWAISIFIGVIAAATTGLADIMVCALTGVLLMAISRCFRLRDAYRSLDPPVLLLIVSTIALGTAMEKTGAAQLYAETFLSLFEGLGPEFVLAGIILFGQTLEPLPLELLKIPARKAGHRFKDSHSLTVSDLKQGLLHAHAFSQIR